MLTFETQLAMDPKVCSESHQPFASFSVHAQLINDLIR